MARRSGRVLPEGLQADNSKVYWQAHKEVYEQCVREPMEQLLAELSDEFGPGKLFRPYRDVRFSADKTPYKTTCAATLGRAYISFSAEELAAGGGLYMPDAPTLKRFRVAVDREKSGTELAGIVADLHGPGTARWPMRCSKTTPRGFPADHPRIELLRHKGIAMMKTWPVGAWLGTPRPGSGGRHPAGRGAAQRLAGPLRRLRTRLTGKTEKKMPRQGHDLVVVGAGIVGLAVAREWMARRPADDVVVLERETAPARHQTGHNSG